MNSLVKSPSYSSSQIIFQTHHCKWSPKECTCVCCTIQGNHKWFRGLISIYNNSSGYLFYSKHTTDLIYLVMADPYVGDRSKLHATATTITKLAHLVGVTLFILVLFWLLHYREGIKYSSSNNFRVFNVSIWNQERQILHSISLLGKCFCLI